jgi:hypothetical protein
MGASYVAADEEYEYEVEDGYVGVIFDSNDIDDKPLCYFRVNWNRYSGKSRIVTTLIPCGYSESGWDKLALKTLFRDKPYLRAGTFRVWGTP